MLKCPKIQQCEMFDSTELFFGHVYVCVFVFLPFAKSNQLFVFLLLTEVNGSNGNKRVMKF